jgi:mRNA-degrading endonuclease RelE of RelBE toxin-antitoxin system
MSWEVVYSKQAIKDAKKLKAAGLKPRIVLVLRMGTHFER